MKKFKLKWWHHILAFIAYPAGFAIVCGFFWAMIYLIESFPEKYRGSLCFIALFFFLGIIGHFCTIDDLKK